MTRPAGDCSSERASLRYGSHLHQGSRHAATLLPVPLPLAAAGVCPRLFASAPDLARPSATVYRPPAPLSMPFERDLPATVAAQASSPAPPWRGPIPIMSGSASSAGVSPACPGLCPAPARSPRHCSSGHCPAPAQPPRGPPPPPPADQPAHHLAHHFMVPVRPCPAPVAERCAGAVYHLPPPAPGPSAATPEIRATGRRDRSPACVPARPGDRCRFCRKSA